MRNLQLVRRSETKEESQRQARGSTVSTERRYRYPAEEIWEVSDDRWQVADDRYPLRKQSRTTR